MQEFLWVEKYRPNKLEDCILPDELKNTFQQFINQQNIPNLLLSGSAGVGKTTVAKAMLEELGADYIVVNGSLHGNIDTLRTEIMNFATTVSFILLNEMKAIQQTKSSSFILRYRHFIITLVILLTTLSITGLISFLLLIFYKIKIRNWKTYFYAVLSVIIVTFLPENDVIGAVLERVKHLISNPHADSRLYDHYISITCERDVWAWLFGTGLGNWFNFVSGCSDYIIHKTSNSVLADYIVETGLVGVFAIILIYVSIFKNLKIVLIILSINLFFQLHLSAVGIIAFLLSKTDRSRHL